MTAEESKVILASSLGTVFEWYDFYLYGSLAAIILALGAGGQPPAPFCVNHDPSYRNSWTSTDGKFLQRSRIASGGWGHGPHSF